MTVVKGDVYIGKAHEKENEGSWFFFHRCWCSPSPCSHQHRRFQLHTENSLNFRQDSLVPKNFKNNFFFAQFTA